MTLSRRELLTRGAAGAGVLATTNLADLLFSPVGAVPSGVGPLRPDPAGLLDLPAGFSYSVVSEVGEAMPGGGTLPDRFDGTGAFAARSRQTRLVRNSEQGGSSADPALAAADLTYDPGAVGGTTTTTIARNGDKVDEYVSLAGTYNNCAGGVTPWETWLTCEETETKAGGAFTRDHGFVFEVDPNNPANNVHPTPLTAMGRFAHEAVVIDPGSRTAYLTEDASGPFGLVYRFRPNDRSGRYGAYRAGGTLDAMRCSQGGAHVPDLSVFTDPGERLDVTWVPVPDPLAASTSTRRQFTDDQVTRSQKYEGMWWRANSAYIVCSFASVDDGAAADHAGQVWALERNGRSLVLVARFAVGGQADGPDNIFVTPEGDIILAEDGGGEQFLYIVNRHGQQYPFARNARDDGEFTGPVFSPDGSTLYANLQAPGVTFAITGPWNRLRRP